MRGGGPGVGGGGGLPLLVLVDVLYTVLVRAILRLQQVRTRDGDQPALPHAGGAFRLDAGGGCGDTNGGGHLLPPGGFPDVREGRGAGVVEEEAVLGPTCVLRGALDLVVGLHPLGLLVHPAQLGVEAGESAGVVSGCGGSLGYEVLHGGEEGGGEGLVQEGGGHLVGRCWAGDGRGCGPDGGDHGMVLAGTCGPKETWV